MDKIFLAKYLLFHVLTQFICIASETGLDCYHLRVCTRVQMRPSLLNCAPRTFTPDTCAFTPTDKHLTSLICVLCCVVSIVRYDLRVKNSRKATGLDFIPLKVIKFASNVIDSYLYNIIKDLEKNKYSEEPKTILVSPIFKKNERNKRGNYRPVSIPNGMSKIYEICIHTSLSS